MEFTVSSMSYGLKITADAPDVEIFLLVSTDRSAVTIIIFAEGSIFFIFSIVLFLKRECFAIYKVFVVLLWRVMRTLHATSHKRSL